MTIIEQCNSLNELEINYREEITTIEYHMFTFQNSNYKLALKLYPLLFGKAY